MPTIKQVADHAKVSVATVSRVINKTGYVSLDLQERVQDAMRELKYQPSALARSLRRQETQTVGLLVPQLNHPFFGTFAFAAEKTLFADQYRTFMCSAEEDQDKEDAYIEMLLRQRVDGVIIVPTGLRAGSVRRLIEQNVPVVLVDRDLPGLEINRVMCDNENGGYNGARHLLDLGHRRIALIGGPEYSESMMKRIRSARRALNEAGVDDFTQVLIDSALDQFEAGYQTALNLLSRQPRPTAIFAFTDVLAIGVLHAAHECGLSVPDELSVIGYDDIPMAAFCIPELTTIRQPIYDMGTLAAQLLLSHIGRSVGAESAVLETQLIVRKSTAAPSNK